MNSERPARDEPVTGSRLHAWKGTGRYELVRVIGRGGMGVVYEAVDHEYHRRVALKTLLNFNPDALYRFKNEFRTLADVHHRNLVQLHEFVMTDADHVFFTMELVGGTDFRTYVCRSDLREAARVSSSPPTRPSPHRLTSVEVGPIPLEPVVERSPADMVRLRKALLGLAEGIQALHLAGKLHRDVKPSNVLVKPEGRVVLLDFGVATELRETAEQERGTEMVGTARYMAPEQALDGALTAASDWYSVGVMLYEALVGRPPFVGSALQVLQEKNTTEALPPSVAVTGVPNDLDMLCRALLQTDQAKRPSGSEILRQLREGGGPRKASSPPPVADTDTVFVGRELQLGLLRDAFEATCSGRSITVRVAGTSGMGKSTLVQRFLDGLSEGGHALVLRGRAYERESVPYKAVDSVVDALSRHLMRLSDALAGAAVSSEVWALARLFPVLRRVPSIAAAAEQQVVDPREMRRRAFGALRDLLANLSREKPVVVYIDDVQWGDTDSAALLVDLMRPPNPPPILLVMTYRDNEAQTSAFLGETSTHWPADAESRDISVGPLDPNDAQRLALALLDKIDRSGEQIAGAAARESRGSPFLVGELVRSNLTVAPSSQGALRVLTIEQMVGQRFERLPQDAQRLLELIAVGGRPLPIAVAADAARIYDSVDDVVAMAISKRFVRTGLRGGNEVIEMSHDRIRESVMARLSAEALRAHHQRLAQVLEAIPGADLEALAVHLRGAEDGERAAKYAERAAEHAGAKLAFDQAARLYRMALETIPALSPDSRRLLMRLAEVLEWAGRGTEAAGVYLRAAEGAPAVQRTEIERAAAEQLLTSGRIDEGVAVLDRTLSSVGMSRPRSAVVAIVWLLLYRLYLRLRGLRFGERHPEEVSRTDRARIDILYSVGIGLSLVDTIQAACMQARHLILALRVGDRFQVLRAAALEAATCASTGGTARAQEQELSAIVQRLAEGSEDPEGRAFSLGTRGVSLFLRGDWRGALEDQDLAYAKYPNNRAGWHANGQLFAIWALTFLGRIDQFRQRHARLLIDAERRGDLYTTVSLRIGYSNFAWLVIDEVDAARRHVQEAMSAWSFRGFHLQHYRAMLADANIDLYRGAGAQAYDRVSRDWPKLERSFLLRVQYVRADARFVRARAAVASIEDAPNGGVRVAEAERLAESLSRERMAWIEPLANIIRAGITSATGNRTEAARLLRKALDQVETLEMAMYAAAIRYQLGCLVGGEEGTELVTGAQQAMTAQGIRVPMRFAAMLVPGQWRSSRK
jgi:serine/threonine protein kinase/tetratricopeptide (TPR) repeat protein